MRTESVAGLASGWAWVIYRGVIAVLFGLLAFTRPHAVSLTLVLIFGAYAVAGGAAALASVLRGGRAGVGGDTRLLDGAMGVVVAYRSLSWPARIPATFVWLVGAWAIATGVMEVSRALRVRKVMGSEWPLAAAGTASIAFGLVMLVRPLAGGGGVMWSIGAYALAFGALLTAFGLRLRLEAAGPTARARP